MRVAASLKAVADFLKAAADEAAGRLLRKREGTENQAVAHRPVTYTRPNVALIAPPSLPRTRRPPRPAKEAAPVEALNLGL